MGSENVMGGMKVGVKMWEGESWNGMVEMGNESEMDHLRPLPAASAVYKCKPTRPWGGVHPFESYSPKSGHGLQL